MFSRSVRASAFRSRGRTTYRNIDPHGPGMSAKPVDHVVRFAKIAHIIPVRQAVTVRTLPMSIDHHGGFDQRPHFVPGAACLLVIQFLTMVIAYHLSAIERPDG